MRIMIETTAPLSETDVRILAMLLERHGAEIPDEDSKAPKLAEAATPKLDASKLTATSVPLSGEKPEAAPEAAAEESVPEPAAESAQAEQDQPVTEETMDAAVAEAKKLMQGGKKDAVRAALKAAGVAKVGAIETEGQALAFLTALKG